MPWHANHFANIILLKESRFRGKEKVCGAPELVGFVVPSVDARLLG